MYKLTFASLLIFMSNCNLDGSKTFISNKISVVDKISNLIVFISKRLCFLSSDTIILSSTCFSFISSLTTNILLSFSQSVA